MRVAAGRRAWSRWLAAAGPWRMWSVCPTLLSPGLAEFSLVSANAGPDTALGPALAEVLRTEPRGTCLLIDLDPTVGVSAAACLYRQRLAHPVLLLPRWPYARAVLPVEALVQALLRCAPDLVPDQPRLPHVAFVVDGLRRTPINERPRLDARADNRSQLAVHDLPNLRTLRARGIERVVSITLPPA